MMSAPPSNFPALLKAEAMKESIELTVFTYSKEEEEEIKCPYDKIDCVIIPHATSSSNQWDDCHIAVNTFIGICSKFLSLMLTDSLVGLRRENLVRIVFPDSVSIVDEFFRVCRYQSQINQIDYVSKLK
jgi:hypothetical protein